MTPKQINMTPTETPVYFRLHWGGAKARGRKRFSARNASSAPWGGDGPRRPGYSCMDDPERLVNYFDVRGGMPDGAAIVVFTGSMVAVGPDNEPLVIPDCQLVRWIDKAELHRLAALDLDEYEREITAMLESSSR